MIFFSDLHVSPTASQAAALHCHITDLALKYSVKSDYKNHFHPEKRAQHLIKGISVTVVSAMIWVCRNQ